MSRIEDLIGNINDDALQVELLEEIERLKQRKDFGLVFERLHPESLLLGSAVGVRVGNQVRVRTEPSNRTTYRVREVDDDKARIEAVRTNKPSEPKPAPGTPPEQREAALADLMVVQPFGQPIYPGLSTVDRVVREEDRPVHAVINAENYHALQLLVHMCAGEVDCIYIDPPYNTGARDWKYDNDYVDAADRYQHSKWLSFMEKRLALAKQLLKPDGVLVCTIDENEVNHLGLLLEQELPQARTQMVTICINPSGASGATGMSRVEEYAFFCFLGDARPVAVADDMLVSDADADVVHTSAEGVRWEWLMRGGNAWYRSSRLNLCYPILLTDDGKHIVRAGGPWMPPSTDDGSDDESARPQTIDGHPVAWPVRKDGKLGIWRVDSAKLNWLAEHGYAYVSRRNESRGTWTIKYLMAGTIDAIEAGVIDVTGRDPDTGRVTVALRERRGKTVRTMWYRGRHIAGGGGGTQMLNALLGERDKLAHSPSKYTGKQRGRRADVQPVEPAQGAHPAWLWRAERKRAAAGPAEQSLDVGAGKIDVVEHHERPHIGEVLADPERSRGVHDLAGIPEDSKQPLQDILELLSTDVGVQHAVAPAVADVCRDVLEQRRLAHPGCPVHEDGRC